MPGEVNLGAWWQRRGPRTRLMLKVLGVLVALYLLLLLGSFVFTSDAKADQNLEISIWCEALPDHCPPNATENWTPLGSSGDDYTTCLGTCTALHHDSADPKGVLTYERAMRIRHPKNGRHAAYTVAVIATCKHGLENYWHESYWWTDMERAHSLHNWCWYGGKIVSRSSSHDAWVTDWGHTLLRYVVKDEWGNNYCAADMSSCLYRFKAWFACCLNVNPIRVSTHRCLATRIAAYVLPNGAHHSRNIIKGDCPN